MQWLPCHPQLWEHTDTTLRYFGGWPAPAPTPLTLHIPNIQTKLLGYSPRSGRMFPECEDWCQKQVQAWTLCFGRNNGKMFPRSRGWSTIPRSRWDILIPSLIPHTSNVTGLMKEKGKSGGILERFYSSDNFKSSCSPLITTGFGHVHCCKPQISCLCSINHHYQKSTIYSNKLVPGSQIHSLFTTS